MNFLYNICSNTLWLNLKIWCNYKVKNKNNIPKKGRMMIISNHQSNIDAGLLGASINRNLKSYLFAIIGAEYVLRWLPIGTHDWNKFIKPEEIQNMLSEKKFSTVDVKGLEFNPIFNKWKKSNNFSVNYIVCSTKN